MYYGGNAWSFRLPGLKAKVHRPPVINGLFEPFRRSQGPPNSRKATTWSNRKLSIQYLIARKHYSTCGVKVRTHSIMCASISGSMNLASPGGNFFLASYQPSRRQQLLPRPQASSNDAVEAAQQVPREPLPVPGTSASSAAAAPVQKVSYNLSFFDAMKFSGPVPERCNMRIAMALFYPMIQREAATGETVLQQVDTPDWRCIVAAVLIAYATIVPAMKGVKDEDFFWLTVRAEVINGRLAMLGWLSLIILEHYTQACFF
jgi:hypothetical protein